MPRPEEEAEWVLSFVEHSAKARQFMEAIWAETRSNYLVLPFQETAYLGRVDFPYLEGRDLAGRYRGYAVLKDPESHQIVESLLGSEMVALFGDLRGAVQARPVGFEDARKAAVASRLLTYDFSLEGTIRSFYEWSKDAKIYGTGILEAYWDLVEEPAVTRRVEVDLLGNQISSEEFDPQSVVYDDPRVCPVDPMDFFPDPGASRVSEMEGCAKRFRTTAHKARSNPRYDQEAVERAIRLGGSEDSRTKRDSAFRSLVDKPDPSSPHPDLKPLVGYVYYGWVPYEPYDGFKRRRIEVLQGVLVRSEPWFGRLPFFEHTHCPIQGRFWGLSPLEVIRFQQDFSDSMKMSIADAVTRMVYAAPIVDSTAEVDLARLRRWRPDRPILARSVEAIRFLNYTPPVGAAQGAYAQEKSQMREATGATGIFQGFGLGVNRASGTEAAATFQRAGVRPEAQYMLIEREYLPALGRYLLWLNRRFLDDDEALRKRIGDVPPGSTLQDIDSDFDVAFVGTRQLSSRQELLAAYRELIGMAANPLIAAHVPWPEVIARFFRQLGLFEEAQALSDPTVAVRNLMMQMVQGARSQATGNQANQPSLAPVGTTAAEAQGGPLV